MGEVWRAFLKLGVISFGGPVAHLGYLRRELVEWCGWLDEARFAHLLALCQLLPGPASSQLGFALGLIRADWAGAFAEFHRVYVAIGTVHVRVREGVARAGSFRRPGCNSRAEAAGGRGRRACRCHDGSQARAITDWIDAGIAFTGFVALMTSRVPVLIVVVWCGVAAVLRG